MVTLIRNRLKERFSNYKGPQSTLGVWAWQASATLAERGRSRVGLLRAVWGVYGLGSGFRV